MKKIAIIGSGISGMSLAYFLNNKYDITLFEKNNYIGGHSNSINISENNCNIPVDTGFIVFNKETYPNFLKLLNELGVDYKKSNMSFGIKNYDNNLEYSGKNINALFAQRKNIFNLYYIKMIKDIIKFNKISNNIIKNDKIDNDITLYQYLTKLKLGKYFKEYYLLPMASAIWSCNIDLINKYPAKSFLRFFYNHGLLKTKNQPQWFYIKNSSREYIKKITKNFKNKILLNNEIISSKQENNQIILTNSKNENYIFDYVIFANHGNQIYKIISDKSKEEEEILSKIKYSNNIAYLHSDINQMPKNKNAWSSWNYLYKSGNIDSSLTYWMNNLQNLPIDKNIFVTLNPIKEIKENMIYRKIIYEHPIFDMDTIFAQENLYKIQNKRNIYFAGAWTKYGFHEDGVNSAINLLKYFN